MVDRIYLKQNVFILIEYNISSGKHLDLLDVAICTIFIFVCLNILFTFQNMMFHFQYQIGPV